MKLKDYPEVARLVPEKKEQNPYPDRNWIIESKEYWVKEGHNSCIDSLTPLLSLEVKLNRDWIARTIRVYSGWDIGEEECIKIADAVCASSNVIEIRKV